MFSQFFCDRAFADARRRAALNQEVEADLAHLKNLHMDREDSVEGKDILTFFFMLLELR